jgi:hypothetical protein
MATCKRAISLMEAGSLKVPENVGPSIRLMITPHRPPIRRTPSTFGAGTANHGLTLRLGDMHRVEFANIASALEHVRVVATSDTRPQRRLASHLGILADLLDSHPIIRPPVRRRADQATALADLYGERCVPPWSILEVDTSRQRGPHQLPM